MAKKQYTWTNPSDFSGGNLAGDPTITVGSSQEREEMDKLMKQLQKTQIDFVDYAKDRLVLEKSLDAQTEQAKQMTRLYCRAGMMLCLAPLRKGIKPASILKTVGLWMGCCMFSKTFREELNYTVREAMYPAVVKKAEKAGPDSIWAVRKKQMEADKNGGYMPLTPDSAAILKLAFCKQAYEKMREPGTDVEAVMRQYDEAEAALYRHAEKDGISPQMLDRSMRTIAGNMIAQDPSVAMMFAETAYGVVARGANTVHEQHIKEITGVKIKTYERWEGRYETDDGEEFTGAFRPRVPEPVNTIRQMRRGLWIVALDDAKTPEEVMEKLYSPEIMAQQRRYLDMLLIDNDISEDDLDNLNQYVQKTDDIRWMLDFGGENPFSAKGMDMTANDFVKYGPMQEPAVRVGKMPELKTAIGVWMNDHPEYNPGYWQRKANDVYEACQAEGGMSAENEALIRGYLQRRDDIEILWASLMRKPAGEYTVQASGAKRAPDAPSKTEVKKVATFERMLPGEKDKPAMDLSVMRNL